MRPDFRFRSFYFPKRCGLAGGSQLTFFSVLVAILCLSRLPAQDLSPSPDGAYSLDVTQSLQQLDRDYSDFLNKRKRIFDSYSKVMTTLRDTEQDLQRIGNEVVRQQMAALQAMLQSVAMDQMMAESRRRADGFDNRENRRPTGLGAQSIGLKRVTQMGLAQGKTAAELNLALRGSELQQLDAAGQAIVRRRIENFEQAQQLEQEFADWTNEWPKFMDRYWVFSDHEKLWNQNEIQQAIKVLNIAHPENYAAMLTLARLKGRIQLEDEAQELVQRVLEADTALNTIALAIQGEVFYIQGEKDKSKNALQKALKLEKDNALVAWIRAELAADQSQFTVAEPIWRGLLKSPQLEIPARKRLAMLHFNRALTAKGTKANNDRAKAAEHAELAIELDAKPNWQSYLVHAIALFGTGKNEESLQQIEKAKEKASDESLELCQLWEQRIKESEVVPWDFLRRFEGR
jgi:tetratricopeptide (TPR) repeat protein